MAPETSIGPNAPDNMINSPSKNSSANVVRMALIMSSTLAHFLFWYINRGEHIRTGKSIAVSTSERRKLSTLYYHILVKFFLNQKGTNKSQYQEISSNATYAFFVLFHHYLIVINTSKEPSPFSSTAGAQDGRLHRCSDRCSGPRSR